MTELEEIQVSPTCKMVARMTGWALSDLRSVKCSNAMKDEGISSSPGGMRATAVDYQQDPGRLEKA
jgi:hypothetical protein